MIDRLEKGDILFTEPDQFRIVLSDKTNDATDHDVCIVWFKNYIMKTSVFWEKSNEFCLKLK